MSIILKLIIEEQVSYFELKEALKIGRALHNDIILNHSNVSRDHCIITYSANGVYIRDLDSTLGTFINGARVRYSKVRVGDTITIANTFHISLEPEKLTTKEKKIVGNNFFLKYRAKKELTLPDFPVPRKEE